MRHLLWNSNSANSYFDNWDCCDTCCTKSLCFITLASVCLTLFLTFAAVKLDEPLSTRNCRLRAWRSVMVHSVLTSESFKSRCGQRSNWFLEYFVLRIPAFTAILHKMFQHLSRPQCNVSYDLLWCPICLLWCHSRLGDLLVTFSSW